MSFTEEPWASEELVAAIGRVGAFIAAAVEVAVLVVGRVRVDVCSNVF